jgi:hypothetical protein
MSSLSRGGWLNENANPHKNNNPPTHQLPQTRLPTINLLQNKCTLENLHIEARKELVARRRTVPTTTKPQGIHLVSLIVCITIKSTQPQWRQIVSLSMKPLVISPTKEEVKAERNMLHSIATDLERKFELSEKFFYRCNQSQRHLLILLRLKSQKQDM